MTWFGTTHRSAAELEMDSQNAILAAARTLMALGGTAEQIRIAERAVRMAEGRLNRARIRVQQQREAEK